MSPAYRKFLVALLGALPQIAILVQQLVDSHLLPTTVETALSAALAVLTAIGVRQIPNTRRPMPGPGR